MIIQFGQTVGLGSQPIPFRRPRRGSHGADVFTPRFGNRNVNPGNKPASPPPAPKVDSYEKFVAESYVNDNGDVITGSDIVRHFILKRRSLDTQKGPANFYYGKDAPGRRYDSKYFWALDQEFGFRSDKSMVPVVTDLRNSSILKDLNEHKPNAPIEIALTPDTITTYKTQFLSPEAAEKIKDMAPGKSSPFGGSGPEDKKKAELIKILMDLPWGLETKDTNDVNHAQQLLDERFHGLEQLKNRIIQKIAVRQLKGDNRGAIFLLVGPGGTGKTAIAKTIADSLNREYVRLSLAGITDSNKITGHGFTYLGSKPGMIVDAMRKAGSMNPVIQLDEMDKTGNGSGAQGDPKEALLAVLDPDQNQFFTDSYLEVPFDLSKAIFICTANSIASFPEHLLSRVEIIEFPAYLEEEKLQIAKKHVIPEKMTDIGIPDQKVVFEDEGILRVIRRFTREGGVRKMAARIVELLEKAGIIIVNQPAAQQKSTAGKDQIKIGKTEVDSWLDNPYPIPAPVDKHGRVGQVNGLYYSIIGGGRMPIQVTHTKGRGKLTMTGSLRDVMKEAAQVVLTYIQTNAQSLNIPQDTAKALENGQLDIHIHYPDTATPKDGPSAGISTFLALYSSLSGREIPQNIGLTGEIGLHGEVMPIGGLKEKISGAYSQGVTRFIVPKSNMDQVEDAIRTSGAFAKVAGKVDIHYVSNVTEIIALLDQLSPPPTPPTSGTGGSGTPDPNGKTPAKAKN